MKTALALTAFFGIIIGWAEMGVLPADPSLNDLDLPQADQPIPVSNNHQPRKCEPNQDFRKDCNTCLCNSDGTDYTCSRKVCGKPNVRKRSIDVAISRHGAHQETEKDVLKLIRSRRSPGVEPSNSGAACTPGTIFTIGCQTCYCDASSHPICVPCQKEISTSTQSQPH